MAGQRSSVNREKRPSPILHRPGTSRGPPKGYTLHSPQSCPTHRKIRYEVPSLCTTRYDNSAIVGISVQLKVFIFYKKDNHCETQTVKTVSAVNFELVHSKQGSYE